MAHKQAPVGKKQGKAIKKSPSKHVAKKGKKAAPVKKAKKAAQQPMQMWDYFPHDAKYNKL
jgi:hypothetical protein